MDFLVSRTVSRKFPLVVSDPFCGLLLNQHKCTEPELSTRKGLTRDRVAALNSGRQRSSWCEARDGCWVWKSQVQRLTDSLLVVTLPRILSVLKTLALNLSLGQLSLILAKSSLLSVQPLLIFDWILHRVPPPVLYHLGLLSSRIPLNQCTRTLCGLDVSS